MVLSLREFYEKRRKEEAKEKKKEEAEEQDVQDANDGVYYRRGTRLDGNSSYEDIKGAEW